MALPLDRFMLLYQHGMIAHAIDLIGQMKRSGHADEDDLIQLDASIAELQEELEYVNPRYVNVSEQDIQKACDKMLKDILGFFG